MMKKLINVRDRLDKNFYAYQKVQMTLVLLSICSMMIFESKASFEKPLWV
jgi:hypothetical protein